MSIDAYGREVTERCERALITLLGDVGPWAEQLYLVGGLVPTYLVKTRPADVEPHIGTTDVDLVVQVGLADSDFETYRTLQKNLQDAGFSQTEPSFQWERDVDGINVKIEFLCETDQVAPGRILKHPEAGVGSKFAALNIPGVHLVAGDYVSRELEGARLDGGISRVVLRVANLLPFVILKINAYQDRHKSKDVYDLLYCVLYMHGRPSITGESAAKSPVVKDAAVGSGLTLVTERFESVDHDGAVDYGKFMGGGDSAAEARYRQQAVSAVAEFLNGMQQ